MNFQGLEDTFRRDLFYRLQGLHITVPPLAARGGDIILLAEHFLNAGRYDPQRVILSPALKEALLRYAWPGNVRELRNEMERMRLMKAEAFRYDVGDLSPRCLAPRLDQPELSPMEDVHEHSRSRHRIPEASAPVPSRRQADRAAVFSPQFVGNERLEFRRLDKLRDLFRQLKKLTRLEISRTMKVCPATATKDLKTLRREGVIDKVEPSPSPRSHCFVLKKDLIAES